MINLTIWLVAGSAIGWLASVLMRTNSQRGVILNVLLGIAGAVIAGWAILPLVGASTINQNDFSFFSLAYLTPANYNAALDFNNDGRIDIADFGQFSVRFFTTLP
jgi:uncharacterized membrane protein YeaQ/YmgE (transglycosylase-associated protein family)